jgi:hypothetical protein
VVGNSKHESILELHWRSFGFGLAKALGSSSIIVCMQMIMSYER